MEKKSLTPINREIIDTIRNEGDMNSPRVRNLISAISYSNVSHTEMLRAFAQNFIDMDKDMTDMMKELVECRSTTTKPHLFSGFYQGD